MKKIKYIIGIVILVVISCMVVVYADYLYDSSNVEYNNSNSTLNSTSVQGAIDELYTKVNEMASSTECPNNYKKNIINGGFNCLQKATITYDANGGSFLGGATTNEVHYNFLTKISKTSNVDENGNKKTGSYNGYMQKALYGQIDKIQVDNAVAIEVTITYETYPNDSYSYVSIYDGSVTPTTSNSSSSVSGKLYGSLTTKSFAVAGDTVQLFYYNSKEQTDSASNYLGYYAVIKAVIYDDSDNNYITPTRNNMELLEWNTKSDGSGISYDTRQAAEASVSFGENITLYAQWINTICKRATVLHTETCNGYCTSSGFSSGGTITYGQLGTSGILTTGDAFDCDVNGDGVHDSQTERFYYVSDYNGLENNYAVLIYYKNVGSDINWRSSQNGYMRDGPITAITQLPTIEQWINVSLRNDVQRLIETSDNSIIKANFSYDGYAARLIKYREINKYCTYNFVSAGCYYLLENTVFSKTTNPNGYWTETASSNSDTAYIYFIDGLNRSYNTDKGNYLHGVRPVIEVSKTQISY